MYQVIGRGKSFAHVMSLIHSDISGISFGWFLYLKKQSAGAKAGNLRLLTFVPLRFTCPSSALP